MRDLFKRILLATLISWVVQGLWVGLEVYFYGYSIPSKEDTIIGMILYTSLYCNFVRFIKRSDDNAED